MRTSGYAKRTATPASRHGSRTRLPRRDMQVELEIGELLVAWRMGDADALNRLFPLVYEDSSGSPVGNGPASAVAAP